MTELITKTCGNCAYRVGGCCGCYGRGICFVTLGFSCSLWQEEKESEEKCGPNKHIKEQA